MKLLKHILNKPKKHKHTSKLIIHKKKINPNKQNYLKQEILDISKFKEFLNDLEDNLEQKRGVISPSKRILVLAGAGSGKTNVLTKRIIHLVKNKQIPLDEIMAITFTKNAATEMRQRVAKSLNIKEENLKRNIRTFHSFCLSILKQNEQFDVLSEKDQREIIHKIIFSYRDQEDIMDSLYSYIQDALIDAIKKKDNQNSRYSQIKNKPDNFGKQNIKTNSGIFVKSKSERDIANFLTSLGINFEYEEPVDFGDGQFKPDFKIDKDIFIEHWCYEENTPAIPQINKEVYLKHRKWKEHQYHSNNLKLISVEEREMKDLQTLYLKLKNELGNALNKKLEQKQLLEILNLSDQYKRAYDRFIEDIIEIINLAKSRLYDASKIRERVKKEKKEKVKNFYNVLIPVMERYEEILKSMDYGKKDFNDLIQDTIILLRDDRNRREYYQNKIKYLLVDEFQDVSYGQAELLKTLITPDTSFFAVGDDWQSIYGWRGSDVDYILNFKDHFGKAEKIILPYNYRSSKNIVAASSYFIQRSKKQHKKNIKCIKEHQKDKSKILQWNSKDDFEGARYVINQIQQLTKEDPKLTPNDFLILYRSSRNLFGYKQEFAKNDIPIKPTTIHGSKGMEAKYVFVLGLKGGVYGFPNFYADKDIKKVIFYIPIEDKEEEERRIFYVAMTRAKKGLFLISEDGNESEFLADIPEDYKLVSSANKKNNS